jgi:hypothetical protein
MSFYKELNFSYSIANDRLLDRINVLKVKDSFYTTILAKPQEYLHPELIDIFGSIGIQPQFITIFGIPNLSVGTSSLHTDIIYKNNNWTKIPGGINWELTPGEATWRWYDSGDQPELYPETPQEDGTIPFNGIHHNIRKNQDSSGFTLLETYQTTFNKPVLFRTDLPHQISYSTTSRQRVSMSIKFSTDDISTWDQAVEIFKPFFK